jgi:glycosyltransferase involved in cell wall biosynthesis
VSRVPEVTASGRRRRVCVLLPSHWEKLIGGAEYQAKLLVDHLVESGSYDVFYLARFVDPEFSPSGYKILRVQGPEGLRRFGYFFDAFSLLGLLREIRPDVIYQRVACAYTGLAAYYAKRHGCRMVWHIASEKDVTPPTRFEHVLAPHKGVEAAFTAYGIRNASHIIAQTADQKRLLETYYRRRPAAIVRNFHPQPLDAPTKWATPTVLWIGNFKCIKRPDVFIGLAGELSTLDEVQMLMIGERSADSAWQAELDERISKITRLRHLGAMTQEDVNAHLARAHILVNTSDYEGFSNTFIQAWMRNVAVVSLNVNPDGVFDADRMGTCARGRQKSLADSVRRLIRNACARKVMIDRAREEAQKLYSTGNIEQIRSIIDGAPT